MTLDDLPSLETIKQALRPEDTRWILVDHNKLQGVLGLLYTSRVHGVIDHHDDEGSIPQDLDSEPRVIEKCGSCTSLVIRTLRSSWDAISRSASSSSSPSCPSPQSQGDPSLNDDSKATKAWEAQLAKTALASILIDTANLFAEGKVEAADIEAVQYLESKILPSTKENIAAVWDRTQFYNDLHTAKQNIDFLSLNDILRQDYKEWPSTAHPSKILGISSVVKPISFLAAKAAEESPDAENAFDQAIQTFMQCRHLSLFAIMTNFSTPPTGRKRELLLQASPSPSSDPPAASAAAAASRFVSQSRAELGLKSLHIPGMDSASAGNDRTKESNRQVWTQKELNKSRKQVAPLLRAALG